MARDFSKNTSNFMSLGANAVGPLIDGLETISFLCRVRFDTLGSTVTHDDLLSVVINGSTNGLACNLAAATPKVRVGGRSVSTDTFRFREGATTVTTGEHTIGCVWLIGADDIRVYLDGVDDSTGSISGTWSNATYTNGTPTTPDSIGCAMSGASPISTERQTDGRISEWAIFAGDIGTDSFAAFHAGYSPELLSLPPLTYFQLLGADSPERDHWGGLSGTISGTVAAADHPPMIYAPGVLSVVQGVGAAPTTNRRRRFFCGAA